MKALYEEDDPQRLEKYHLGPDLRMALVYPRHTDLYRSNAYFRASVDTLVNMLPLWLNGLAEHAGEWDKKMEEMRAFLESNLSFRLDPEKIMA